MKIRLDKMQIVFFPIIIIVCIAALSIGIYVQFFQDSLLIDSGSNNLNPEFVLEELKDGFEDIFLNSVEINGYNTNDINKNDLTKEVIYTSYEKKDKAEGKYDIDVAIPKINIKDSKVIDEFNNNITQIFQNKVENILNSGTNNNIYNVKYQAYINDGILSLVIQSTLKEGGNAQRVIVKTYNYNVTSGKEVTLEDVLLMKGLNRDEVARKIKEDIKKESDAAKALQDIGYTVYSRDLRNDMYELENTTNFFIGKDNYLYIIYAYGNTNYTSEIDLVIF